MALTRTARRVATIALALATTTGLGTAVAASSQAATISPITTHTTTTTSAYDFSTRIVNEGGQAEIDACKGGLTKMTSVTNYVGKGYYPIHNECGGAPILDLAEGSSVHIDGLGDFVVVDTLDVMRGDDASLIKNLAGDILLQTCHNSGNGMRVVALQAAA